MRSFADSSTSGAVAVLEPTASSPPPVTATSPTSSKREPGPAQVSAPLSVDSSVIAVALKDATVLVTTEEETKGE